MVISLNYDILDQIETYLPVSKFITTLRDEQANGLKEIVEALKAGHRRIVVSGATGIGKSLLIAMLARALADMGLKCTITSPLNTLVDQFQNSYGDYVSTWKGKDNYLCECARRLGKTVKCSDGYCITKRCGTKLIESVKSAARTNQNVVVPYPMDCEGCRLKCVCKECPYKLARQAYLEAKIGNTNYTMYLMGMRESDAVFIDESHATKKFIRLNYRISINEHWQQGLSWGTYKLLLVETLAEKKRELDNKLALVDAISTEAERVALIKVIRDLERAITNIERILDDYQEFKEPWVPVFETRTDNRTGNKYESVSFEPITTDRHEIGIYEPDQLVFYFSATPIVPIEKDGTKWHLIELGSPFNPDIRPWAYVPVDSMKWTNRTNALPKLAEYIDGIRKKRPGKILVHCNSYDIAYAMGRYFIDVLHNENIIIQSRKSAVFDGDGNEMVSRNLALEKFLLSSYNNLIFFSVNMYEGIDLYQWEGNAAVFTQIILKTPFRDHKSPLVTELKRVKGIDVAEEELNAEVAALIMQGVGRINRNDKKFKIAGKKTLTLILDRDFNGGNMNFYEQNKHLFMKHFKEAEIHRTEIAW